MLATQQADSGVLWPNGGDADRGVGEEGKKEEKKLQLNRISDDRIINTLPWHSPHNYTPYFNLEFDMAVQNYCRNHQINQTNQQQMNNNKHDGGWQDNSSLCNFFTRQVKDSLKKKSTPTATSKSFSSSPQPIGGGDDTGPSNRIVRNCKVVVSGDVAVGKTCLVNRFSHAIYSSNYKTTIGVDFDLQRFNILGQPYVLQIWDTAGLERFKCVTSSYYRGCQVALIVFDMSNMNSLASVLKWRDEILFASKTFDQLASECDSTEYQTNTVKLRPDASGTDNCCTCSDSNTPLLFLVGTKCDLPLTETSRAFMVEQANKIAALIQAELWFVSAQSGENVNELFTRIAALSFNRCINAEVSRLKFEASTMGASLKEKILQQQRELWNQSSKLIKITKKKEGDDRRSRCVNVQCVIK